MKESNKRDRNSKLDKNWTREKNGGSQSNEAQTKGGEGTEISLKHQTVPLWWLPEMRSEGGLFYFIYFDTPAIPPPDSSFFFGTAFYDLRRNLRTYSHCKRTDPSSPLTLALLLLSSIGRPGLWLTLPIRLPTLLPLLPFHHFERPESFVCQKIESVVAGMIRRMWTERKWDSECRIMSSIVGTMINGELWYQIRNWNQNTRTGPYRYRIKKRIGKCCTVNVQFPTQIESDIEMQKTREF